MVCFMTKKICDSDHNSRPPAPLGTPHRGAAACFAIYLAFWSPDGVQNSPQATHGNTGQHHHQISNSAIQTAPAGS